MSVNRAAERAASATGRRGEVLAALRESSATLSIAEVARRVGVHPNTARFHLINLVDHGQAERVDDHRPGRGRPPLLFRARPGMDPAGPRDYRLLAEILAARLAASPEPTREAVEAGRTWGTRLAGPAAQEHAVDRLASLLDDLGFAPELHSARRIGLRHCPFLELAETQGHVVCDVHLGLMRGAMAALDPSVTVDELEPFVEPGLCVAHLGSGEPAVARSRHAERGRR